ncbi:response regulator [Patescibacteria group bacterium]|nr:response regulator [Patescibacteria group bacterium]MCH8048614.1 response regulator [Patescibacteria group bacterium]
MAKILIIEDDKFLRELLVKKVGSEGYEVVVATDGEEGLKMAKEENPSLILLDLILPAMDGFEVLRRIKEAEETKHIPVIILSNLGQKEDIDKGVKLGAKDYMIKAHFTPGEIAKKIQEILS